MFLQNLNIKNKINQKTFNLNNKTPLKKLNFYKNLT